MYLIKALLFSPNPLETNTDQIFEIFHEAKGVPAGSERQEFLARVCEGNLDLCDKVTALLRADDSAGEFLTLAAWSPATVLTEGPGDWVGRYKLVEQIGEGGCGVVYLADQERPVRRRVALKIIKLGMDTKQVVSRFEGERQALAVMDHPNIARVYDAGATDNGRPYFVMEFVPGKKVTQFCDEQRLGQEARLKLFLEICDAIQHAHQKGISIAISSRRTFW
jgi:eukaryotic-like serine/threonine-protein kinase